MDAENNRDQRSAIMRARNCGKTAGMDKSQTHSSHRAGQNTMTIETTISKEQALQQIAEHLVKETTAKMVNDIGPMLASGSAGSVTVNTEHLFAGGKGSAGQAGAGCSISMGGE
jgi:hypothetical protein